MDALSAWLAFFCLLFMGLATHAVSADVTVFDVRRTLRLSDHDTVYHDYYLNGGSEAGLSPGMAITVTRRMPLYDSYQNHSAGDLQLKVARLKIIHVQKGLAVGRLMSEFSRENAPLLEDPFIMVGDALDMSTATATERKDAAVDAAPTPPAPVTPAVEAPKTTAPEAEKKAEPQAAVPPLKPVAQIMINSVDLSSHAPDPTVPARVPSLQ